MVLAIVLASAAGLVIIDQVIKYFILQNLAPVGSVSIIDNLLSLTYVENRGVAFGMFQNHVWLFAVVTLLLMSVFVWLIISGRMQGKLFYAAAILMIGGGIGNLIDRLFRGFVVDYISLSFFPPVCNFADYCITIGAFLFIFVLLLQGTGKKKEAAAEGASEMLTEQETASKENDTAGDTQDTGTDVSNGETTAEADGNFQDAGEDDDKQQPDKEDEPDHGD